MLQSSSYCSCGKHAGFFHCRGSCYGIGSYVHACCHSRTFMRDDIIPCGDATLPSSSSRADKLACACCQVSPATLVVPPSPVASLSSLVHLIWSRTDGDVNFQSIGLPCFILPCFSRSARRSIRTRMESKM